MAGLGGPPGYLTPHGFQLMELFGAYDRVQLTSEGLVSREGCAEAGKVTFYADSDQRTRETGKALAKGLFPGCSIPVTGLPEGTNDPLFHLPPADVAALDSAVAAAAISGRIGNNPDKLTEAYRAQLVTLDKILADCGKPSEKSAKRISLLDIPATSLPDKAITSPTSAARSTPRQHLQKTSSSSTPTAWTPPT